MNPNYGYEQEQDQPYPYSPALPYSGQKDRYQQISSIFEIDNEPIVDSIVNYLRGYKLIDGSWVPIDERNPHTYALMNEKGIAAITPILRIHVDKLIIMSDLEMENIYCMSSEVAHTIISLLAKNYHEFGIQGTAEHLDIVYNMIDHAVFSTLRRAFHGGERKHRETIMKMVEQFVQREEEKKKPGMSIAALFRRSE